MILDKAVNRLAWRFTNKKNFTPNADDIKAVNDILTWVNQQKKESVRNNKLFAKLYIYMLNNKIEHFNTTIFDDVPQKEVSRLLTMPLDLFYTAFHNNLHNNKLTELFNKHKLLDEDKKEDRAKLENITDNEVKQAFEETYTFEVVVERLNDMVSEAINRFSHYD